MPNPTPAAPTATRRLVDMLLVADGGSGLDNYVKDRRAEGLSWRRISLDLLADIHVDVHERTLWSWYPELRDTGDQEAS